MPSLQDQLLGAGLVDAKKAKKTAKEKRKQQRQAHKTGEAGEDQAIKDSAQAARAEKAERDRELNRQREQEAQRKAIAAQIRQLIETHRQPRLARGDAEVEYNFTDGKHIKKLLVSPKVQQQIVRGQLAITRLAATANQDEKYELVPRIIADKIAERDPQALVVANTRPSDEPEDDDPYKDYIIPDDLMW